MVNAATYTVTNTNDSGAGSLRQAIIDANTNPGADIIQFNIPDGGLPGQYFEGATGTRVAVIQLISPLPIITGSVDINGTTQANSNTGSMTGRVVGAGNITQPNINFPDVYIVPNISGGYVRSANTTDATRGYGNGININTTNVTIRGIAISGFGNTNTIASNAGLSGDICILRSNTVRSVNIGITECFISSDARGNAPTPASNRRSLGCSIMIGGNNNIGTISRNYMRNMGCFGIHFNGGIDHASVGPANTNLPCRLWTIDDNQIIDVGWNNQFVGPGHFVTQPAVNLVADAINTMNCRRFLIRRNYIENVEQVGIDLGWNADSNYVENNSITGFIKTNCGPVQAGIRAALSSRRDTIIRNRIFNNTSSAFMSGIWIDQSAPPTGTIGLTFHDNEFHFIAENVIYNNSGSGISLSTFTPTTTVNNRNNFFSQNILYDNTGLGIDLQFVGNTGAPLVTVNDNADADAGTNNITNFPVIDSVKKTPSHIIIYGKVTAGAYMEFFFTDGGTNRHGGRLFDYGEAEFYIGSGTEGTASDLRTTTGLSYNIDGNVATNNMNGFTFSFPMVNLPVGAAPFVTATATISNNTSELAPMLNTAMILDDEVLVFNGKKRNAFAELNWEVSSNPDIHYFEIEHAIDGIHFSSVAVIAYTESGREDIQYYSKSVPNTTPGNNFYRLKSVYKDGKFVYSKTVLLNFSGITSMLKATPNPFTNKINIEFQETQSRTNYQVRLLDVSGKIIQQKDYRSTFGQNRFTLSVNNLKNQHIYIIEIVSETGEKFQQKLLHH